MLWYFEILHNPEMMQLLMARKRGNSFVDVYFAMRDFP